MSKMPAIARLNSQSTRPPRPSLRAGAENGRPRAGRSHDQRRAWRRAVQLIRLTADNRHFRSCHIISSPALVAEEIIIQKPITACVDFILFKLARCRTAAAPDRSGRPSPPCRLIGSSAGLRRRFARHNALCENINRLKTRTSVSTCPFRHNYVAPNAPNVNLKEA